MTPPLPLGFRLRPDPQTRRLARGHLIVGGTPRRALRLSDDGARLAAALLDGAAVATPADAALARRLLDAGVAQPVPPRADATPTVQVVVPTFDDAAALHRCLTALTDNLDVLVVDDGSRHADEVAGVAAATGAHLLRRPHNDGPAAARNAGAAATSADVVAFVDSDVVVDADALRALLAHLRDPAVVAVAPRVQAVPGRSGTLGALAASWSPLDMGAAAGVVGPGRRVRYVPSALLLVRRDALARVGGFDESLRYGEDVDLVWRLTADGGTVRYDPTIAARHEEPATWRGWLSRRFRYGTSAGQLGRRHGPAAVSLSLPPASLAVAALLLVRRPAAAAVVVAGTAARVHRRLRRVDVPMSVVGGGALLAPAHATLATARWLTQVWWPALAVAAATSRRARPTVAAVVAAPPLVEWLHRRPRLDPLRWSLGVLLDDVAYGAGVWRGAVAARTTAPLLPQVR